MSHTFCLSINYFSFHSYFNSKSIIELLTLNMIFKSIGSVMNFVIDQESVYIQRWKIHFKNAALWGIRTKLIIFQVFFVIEIQWIDHWTSVQSVMFNNLMLKRMPNLMVYLILLRKPNWWIPTRIDTCTIWSKWSVEKFSVWIVINLIERRKKWNRNKNRNTMKIFFSLWHVSPFIQYSFVQH